MFLDFEACTNAAWDHKDLCEAEYQAIRQRLEKAGLGLCIEEYLGRLRELESRRPSIGGDHRRFDEVRSYREAVARLSLATAAAIALNGECLEEEIRATQCDSDVETLFRILMQCQIIDDVLDYTEDRVRRPAQFPDSIRVAAAGHGIDRQSGTVLCRERPSVHQATACFRCAWRCVSSRR